MHRTGDENKMGKVYEIRSSSETVCILLKDLSPINNLKNPLIGFPDVDIFLFSQPVMLIHKMYRIHRNDGRMKIVSRIKVT